MGVVKIVRNPKSLDKLKEEKITQLKDLCSITIMGPFVLSETGYTYTLDVIDQLNLTGKLEWLRNNPEVIDNIIWKITVNGKSEYVPHTRDQIFALSNYFHDFVQTNILKRVTLSEQILNATTKEEINLINW